MMVTGSDVRATFGVRHSRGALGGPLLALSCAVLLALVGGSAALGATVYVPDDYSTIQAAVNAAGAGDTVYVRAGTYYEHVTIGKFLTLQGENRETTIIDGSGGGNVVYVGSPNVLITGLTVRNGYRGVYFRSASSSRIVDCNVSHNYLWGIDLEYCPGSEVRNCDVSDSYGTGLWDGYGIRTWSSSYSVIEDVRVFDNKGGRAVCPYHSSGTVIRNVEMFNNAGGLLVGYGSYEIVNISIRDSGYGVYFNAASGGSLRDSVIRSVDGSAVSVTYYSSSNVIEGNTMESNGGGVGFSHAASSNVVQGNIIESNECAIGFGGWPQPQGNRFYHNDIIGNAVQVGEHPDYPAIAAQVWDNGYPSGGNYWSDYSGVDLFSGLNQDIPGSDGIGDTPYWIPPDGPLAKDNYPLMRPWRADLALPVDIDIKPGSYPNSINLGSQGVIPIAIFSSDTFDATQVNPETVALAGAGVAVRGKGSKYLSHEEDVDGDDLLDLVVQVETQNLDPGEVQDGFAFVTGLTYDDQAIEGMDEITIVPPEGDETATASTEAASTADGQAPSPVLMVDIDAQPGSDPNSINLGAEGVIPVAIFSSDTFDATQVDPSSVILDGFEGVAVIGIPSDYTAHQEDVDGDGLLDLVVQVEVMNLNPGAVQDGVVWLAGCTHGGQPIEGTDAIIIVPPEG